MEEKEEGEKGTKAQLCPSGPCDGAAGPGRAESGGLVEFEREEAYMKNSRSLSAPAQHADC